MSALKTPIIATVIGEGGSGGALAIGVGDKLFMMKYSTYSVISPEGCASILWKSADKAEEAAEAMGITAKSLQELGLVDEIIEEPLGAAHRDYDNTAKTLKNSLVMAVNELKSLDTVDLVSARQNRIRQYGCFNS
jgi:acetyl-CoA carboxylase carboxyl transferase subunit alpha